MNLGALLVVLSACNTALGCLTQGLRVIVRRRRPGGRDLRGRGREPFGPCARLLRGERAGAARDPLADCETTALMASFFGRLKGEEADFNTALTAAQDELRGRSETSHPVFRDPFVLIGDAARTL